MTLLDTGKIFDAIKAAYPRFYAKSTPKEEKNAIALWTKIFENDDVLLVGAALRAYIDGDESGFPPSPGQIRAKLRLFSEPEGMTEQEAWARILKAIDCPWGRHQQAFDALPEDLKRVVGRAEQLREWGMMDAETVQSVVASNVQRSFRKIAQRNAEIGKLSPEIKALAEKFRFKELGEEGAMENAKAKRVPEKTTA